MKKVIALLAVCGFALAFVACGKKAEEASTADTTAVETPAAADTAKVDTAATAVDTAAH
jgi:ABC-type enterochelin transport system substrate-binding protein